MGDGDEGDLYRQAPTTVHCKHSIIHGSQGGLARDPLVRILAASEVPIHRGLVASHEGPTGEPEDERFA